MMNGMLPSRELFERSVRRQIEQNLARTPTERFKALCDLLDFARAMAPDDPTAQKRRRRALDARQRERERFRAYYRRLAAAERAGDSTGV